MNILERADDIINGDRQDDYGPALENWERTSKLWSAVLQDKLKKDITPEEALLCMTCVKIAREVYKPKEDNLVDGAGYLGVIERVKRERRARAAMNNGA